MVYIPRTTTEIYDSLRTGLIGRIEGLTNFVTTSFNFTWTNAFAERFRENEVALLAAQLSGYIDYAGGPVTQEQLDALGIASVTPAELNEYMEDEDLDELVALVGVTRSPGNKATGTVTVTTVSASTTIPAGTVFGTQPDADGEYYGFVSDEAVNSPTGTTEVSVDVTAQEVGDEYNVGSGQITYLVNPPTGVQSSSNPAGTTGGADRETNSELRARAKNAIFDKSGGGTAEGIRGYVSSNVEAVSSVAIKEYTGGNVSTPADYVGPGGPGGASADSPFVDVIVEGGDSTDVTTAIEESRPVAIQHNLVRPSVVQVNIIAEVDGTSVTTEDAEAAVEQYIDKLGLGQDVIKDKIVQRIMNADTSIDGITSLTIEIANEKHTYSTGTDIYALDKGVQMIDQGVTEITGLVSSVANTFSSDYDGDGVNDDYTTIDDDADSSHDSVDWSLAGDNPDDGTEFSVTYKIDDDIPISEYEKSEFNQISITLA